MNAAPNNDHPAYRLTEWILQGNWGGTVLGIMLGFIVLSVLSCTVWLWFLQGARLIAAGWVWRQFWAWRRSRKATRHSTEYEAVMASAGWRATRKQAIREAGGRCERCGVRGTPRAPLHGHHLTYARLGRERRSDLAVLCKDCHQAAHGRRF